MKTPVSLLLFCFIFCFSQLVFSQSATVISENANLRGTPKQDGKVVDVLPSGTQIQILKQSGVWFLVQTENYAGWLHDNTIKLDGSSQFEMESPPVIKKPMPSYSIPQSISAHTYIRGSRGGCYYINSHGNKTYVERSLCN